MKTKAYNLNRKSHNPVTKRHLHSCAGKLYVKTVTVLDQIVCLEIFNFTACAHSVKL